MCMYVFSPPVALRAVVDAAKPGVSVLSLCEKGDAFITAETSKVFKKEKEIKKGKWCSRAARAQSAYSEVSRRFCLERF